MAAATSIAVTQLDITCLVVIGQTTNDTEQRVHARISLIET